MASIAPFSTTSAGNAITLIAGEDAFIRGTTVIVSTDAVGIVASLGSHAITVLGEVYGDDYGVELGASGTFANSRVSVGPGGAVTGRVAAIDSSGSSVSIENAGLITGNEGIDHNTGSSFGLANSGTIAASFGNAVGVDSSFGQIVNHGVIASSFSGDGISLTNTQSTGSFVSVVNFGRISGYFVGIRASGDDKADIRNHGEVGGDIQTSSGDDFILNTGTITGNMSVSTGNDTVINRGMVDQDIFLSNGNDYFDGRGGVVLGEVQGGLGDDLYLIDDPGIELVEFAGQGLDTVGTEVSFALPENFENLSMIGTADINGFGNDLDNLITPNIGRNFVDGGAGIDTMSYGGSQVGVVAQLFGAVNPALVNPSTLGSVTLPIARSAGTGGAEGDILVNVENLFGSAFNDILLGSGSANVLRGLAGDDILFGNAGDDVLEGGVGADRMDGGSGTDFAAYTTAGSGVVADMIVVAGNTSDAAGDVFGNIQNLRGSMFNDTLKGTFASNRLEGLGGDDVLQGRGGGDIYLGGAGNDTFVFQNGFGAEAILDFDALNDNEKIDLVNVAAITDFTDLFNNHLSISGGDSVITAGAGTITLLGVAVSDLDANDFIF